MSKKIINSHYVPRLILRQWSPRLCLFNIKTGDYKEDVKIEKAFCEKEFYSQEVEENLNKKIESQFGDLFNNKILKADSSIELSRDELLLIKKFLIISILRSKSPYEDGWKIKRNLYKKHKEDIKHIKRNTEIEIDNLQEKIDSLKEYANSQSNDKHRNTILNGIKEYEKNMYIMKTMYKKMPPKMPNDIEMPFIEKEIENETDFDYWMRTLNVILDTNGTPEEISNHPNKTYEAFRWANIIYRGYIAFWDSEYIHDEFIITDIGMTSENEKGWDDLSPQNIRKIYFLASLLDQTKNNKEATYIWGNIMNMYSFYENFMMFPISAKRMIVLINPFFKFRVVNQKIYNMISLDELTNIPNEKLFYPNSNKYVTDSIFPGFSFLFHESNKVDNHIFKHPIYHPDDKYIYDIKRLTSKETTYCNCLFLDRITEWVGFSSLNKALKSIFEYKIRNSYPYIPRVDYKQLYKIINERYSYCHINLNNIRNPGIDETRLSLFLHGLCDFL